MEASVPRISDLERGVYAASVDAIERLAQALNVPLHVMLEDTGSLALPKEQAPRKSERARLPRASAKKRTSK